MLEDESKINLSENVTDFDKINDGINTARAWIEVNLDNLEHNVNEIKRIIPNNTKIMAVVKANAYGHGAVPIAKKLNDIGVYDFAVATLSEGIELRKAGITGNILILGYTDFKDIGYVIKYDLIQTLVDFEYANRLNELLMSVNDKCNSDTNSNNDSNSIFDNSVIGKKLKVHVKINTGMNRIGERFDNFDNILKIYQMSSFDILGTFSHLCVSDSLLNDDVDFTKSQISNFENCVSVIKNAGYNTGMLHIQASYGILNYPDLKFDYVRPGIILYGTFSNLDDVVKTSIDLKPVLSLKARVSSIRDISSGDSVSYGRTFIADSKMRVATVCIGYADGYPRELSNKGALVMVNGKFAPVIGRVCMDQMVIDISKIDGVKQGDVVTLIGDDEKISAGKVAATCNTITNELLCRLSKRLPIVLV